MNLPINPMDAQMSSPAPVDSNNDTVMGGAGDNIEVEPQQSAHLERLLIENRKLTNSLFRNGNHDPQFPKSAEELGNAVRTRNEYAHVMELPPSLAAKVAAAGKSKKKSSTAGAESSAGPSSSTALTIARNNPTAQRNLPSSSLVRKDATTMMASRKPEWHAPWKLFRVISGHLGWVRSLAVEPDNQWFASGAGDRTIKIWDLATGNLRLTLTGHISAVRGLAISPRHPYLFSCGEDKMVKCWDLETNKVIRHYHGHLSGVYTLALHPTLDVLVTGGRDGVARV